MCFNGSAARIISKKLKITRLDPHAGGKFVMALLVTTCIFCLAGCANSISSNKDDNVPAFLRDILIKGVGNDTRIRIVANKPLTYNLYNITEPSREVIDLSPALLNPFGNTLGVNAPIVSQIGINNLHVRGHEVTRIIFKLKQPVVFSASQDPSKKNEILLTIAVPKETTSAVNGERKGGSAPSTNSAPVAQATIHNNPVATRASGETGMATHPEVPSGNKISAKTSDVPFVDKSQISTETGRNNQDKTAKTGQAYGVMTISKVNVIPKGIEIAVSGVNNNFKFVEMGEPPRLVLDLIGAKNAVVNTHVAVNSFGIKELTLNSYPDKVRIVFEASGKIFPKYRVEVNGLGMKLFFAGE
jgi:type IV pilus assembly protein PilQ